VAHTTPNKETVRRICILQGGTECYIQVNTGNEYVNILTNIENQNLEQCVWELESWCGMKFKLFNEDSESETSDRIRLNGEKILPIDTT